LKKFYITLGITIVEPNEEEIDESYIAELKANQKKLGISHQNIIDKH